MENKNIFGLSWQLAVADFKLRNEGSYLGNLWYLLNPLLLFLILFLIFFDRIGANIPSYPSYLIIGILIYNFFLRTTMDSTNVILNSGFIKSLNFPNEVLVISVILKNIFSHIFEMIIFFIILLFLNVSIYGILFYFLILIFLSIFIYGISLFLSAMTVYFIDLGNIWQFFSTLLWFATPIFYAIEGQSRLFIFNLFNPLYYFITVARDIIVYSRMPEVWLVFGIIVFPLISVVIGSFVFGKLKNKFAEMV